MDHFSICVLYSCNVPVMVLSYSGPIPVWDDRVSVSLEITVIRITEIYFWHELWGLVLPCFCLFCTFWSSETPQLMILNTGARGNLITNLIIFLHFLAFQGLNCPANPAHLIIAFMSDLKCGSTAILWCSFFFFKFQGTIVNSHKLIFFLAALCISCFSFFSFFKINLHHILPVCTALENPQGLFDVKAVPIGV